MRWAARRLRATVVCCSAVGGMVMWYSIHNGATSKTQPSQLSAEEFNALQNKELLAEAFRTTHLPWNWGVQGTGGRSSSSDCRDGHDFTLTLYRLLGCPYCAKVEWVLRYYSVPFVKVDVDTLSGAGIPDSRYTLLPQIRFALAGDASTAGAYVVDSQQIISALSVPLGFAEQLQDMRVLETRRWITERFQGVSFLAANSTWRNAYDSYPHVTTPRYHNIAFRVVGASALYLLSQYKILPNLVAKVDDARTEMLRKDPQLWLEEELAAFVLRLQDHPHQKFHGGKKPDIADLEMYAVTRVVDAHPRLRHVLHRGAFGEWNAAMDAEMQKRAQLVS